MKDRKFNSHISLSILNLILTACEKDGGSREDIDQLVCTAIRH